MQASTPIHYTSEIPKDLDQLLELYGSVEWTTYLNGSEKLETSLKNSSYIICAYDDDRLVGCARGLSDEVAIHFIQELIVHPEYQKRGIGRTLLQKAVDLYPESRKHVLLTDDTLPIKEFYESQGFHKTL